MLLRVHLLWVRFELTTLVVIDTDCIGSYRSTTIRSRPRRALSNGYWVIWLAIQKYHTVRTVLKIQYQNTERGKIDTPNTHIHDRSLSWLGIDTSIQSGVFKLVLWAQTPPLSEMMLTNSYTIGVLPEFFSPTCSSTFFHTFHLSESSFTCTELRANGLAWRLLLFTQMTYKIIDKNVDIFYSSIKRT
jgi:hypothetical protein